MNAATRALGPAFRLAARVALLVGGRRAALEELFARTASAFGSAVPEPAARGTASRLREYARFTLERAHWALQSGLDLGALDGRLYRTARELGSKVRRLLRLRSLADAMAAARLLYRGLGIDFRGTPDGEVTIRACSFASCYTPAVCRLVSALDRGLLAGLADGGELTFRGRITDGAAECRASLDRGTT